MPNKDIILLFGIPGVIDPYKIRLSSYILDVLNADEDS